MAEPELSQAAAAGYGAYAAAVGGCSPRGGSLPRWSQLTFQHQAGWRAAARCVREQACAEVLTLAHMAFVDYLRVLGLPAEEGETSRFERLPAGLRLGWQAFVVAVLRDLRQPSLTLPSPP